MTWFSLLAFVALIALSGTPTATAAPFKTTTGGPDGPYKTPNTQDAYCYSSYSGRMERYAVSYMCQGIESGASQVWLMELVDSSCRTSGTVTVTLVNNEPVATSTSGTVCATNNYLVTVDANQCALFSNPAPTACHGYLDDRDKPAKTHFIVTAHSSTVRYKVELKADCTSLVDPVFKAWYSSAQVMKGVSCDRAWGATTQGMMPLGKAWKQQCCQTP